MNDLLPCPFCGGEAFRDSSADCTGTPSVGCYQCSAHVVAGTQAGADAAWNHRALPAASQPEAEPVAWYTDDYLRDKSATTWDASVADRWRSKGWPVWPLYDSPTPAPVVPAEGLADYDAGLLNDFGGGDVWWWQDYLRAEIDRANEFWREQVENSALRAQQPVAPVSGVTVREAGWQPIETAPHEELVVLGWQEGGVWKQEIALASAGERLPNGYSNRWLHGRATHWMPLPEPPALSALEGK